ERSGRQTRVVYISGDAHDNRLIILRFLSFLKIERYSLADRILIAEYVFAKLFIDHGHALCGHPVVGAEDAAGAYGYPHGVPVAWGNGAKVDVMGLPAGYRGR